ncbi:MAG: hypothetical protein AABX33_02760 [Nanoarchaeota archaeon]
MVNLKSIEAYTDYINNFRNNLIRSMAIRIKIQQQRLQAIELLENNFEDQNGVKLLSRCVKNERWFLRIIEKGLGQTFRPLKEMYIWMKKNVSDEEALEKAERIIDIVEFYYSKIKKIDKRLEAEEYFVEKQDKKSFKKFLRKWTKEMELHSKLIKKVADASDLDNYFKRMHLRFKKISEYPKPIGVMAAVGVGFGPGIQSLANYFAGKEWNKMDVAVSASIWACLFAIFGAMMVMTEIEKDIEKINTKRILRAKESL